jgi:2-oxoacid:acceptor oxidoreductase delta subunit (pyruvate/2-ketoisovalerate family)
MIVESWDERRPIAPWLPAVQDNRYVSEIAVHQLGIPKINYDACNMCSLCWIYCPEGAIARDGEQLTIDCSDCRGCGLCANVCPLDAIFMDEEKE